MPYFLAPIANQQQIDANGDPLSGGKVYTYVAGTSTAAATYTDDTGATPQANPILLNSRGLPTNPVWLQGGRSYKLVVTDANEVVLWTVDDVSGINDATTAAADQWIVYANPPTYLSATSFSLAGDQTLTFQLGRRLKSVNTGGTRYSTILTSSYGAGITTVTVANDSGTLDAGMSSVSYGIISPDNGSLPILQDTAANGYHKLPGGLILQWGTTTPAAAGTIAVVFPIPFPNAVRNVVASVGGGNNTVNTSSETTTGMTVTTYVGSTGAALNGARVFWQAIGY